MRLNTANYSGLTEIGSRRERKIVCYYTRNTGNIGNYQLFLNSIKIELMKKLREHVHKYPIKYNLKLESTYNIPREDKSSENRSFRSSTRPIFTAVDLEKVIIDEDCVHFY